MNTAGAGGCRLPTPARLPGQRGTALCSGRTERPRGCFRLEAGEASRPRTLAKPPRNFLVQGRLGHWWLWQQVPAGLRTLWGTRGKSSPVRVTCGPPTGPRPPARPPGSFTHCSDFWSRPPRPRGSQRPQDGQVSRSPRLMGALGPRLRGLPPSGLRGAAAGTQQLGKWAPFSLPGFWAGRVKTKPTHSARCKVEAPWVPAGPRSWLV